MYDHRSATDILPTTLKRYAGRPMIRSIWNSPWGLLIAANLFWAGNIVLARGLAGHVPPVTLAYWRWTGAFFVAIGFAWPRLKFDLPLLCCGIGR